MADDSARRDGRAGPRPALDRSKNDRGEKKPSFPGWRVTPGAGGRTGPPAKGQRPSPPGGRWLIILLVVGLLALNLWISSQALQPASRVQVPFSPTFTNQVRSGNVSDISSTGNAIQGTFKQGLKYPPNDSGVKATTLFSTQVPSFWSSQELSSL